MFLRTLGACVAASLLSACGGGGNSDDATCSGTATLAFTTTWTVTGGTWQPPLSGDAIVGRVGVPLSARPVISGLPAGCAGLGVFAPGTAAPNLLPGLKLDPATGEISGTPTQAGGTPSTSGPTETGAVQVTFRGFAASGILGSLSVQP